MANWTSQTPRVSVCWHCRIMFLFMSWTSFTMSVIHLPTSLHMSLQLSTADDQWGVGRVGPPHCTCHSTLNCWWPMGVGWVLHISHVTQLSTADAWWGWVWWANDQWGRVGGSSTLNLSLKPSTADDQWGVVWVGSSTLHMSLPTLNFW